MTWSGEQGEIIKRSSLPEGSELGEKMREQRCELVDRLSVLDDSFANVVLEENSLEKVGVVPIYNALRRVTSSQVEMLILFKEIKFRNNHFIFISLLFTESCASALW